MVAEFKTLELKGTKHQMLVEIFAKEASKPSSVLGATEGKKEKWETVKGKKGQRTIKTFKCPALAMSSVVGARRVEMFEDECILLQ